MNNEKIREAELRRSARRNNLRLTKSRGRDPHRPDFGQFALINDSNDFPVTPAGICSVHGCTLDEIEAYLVEFEGEHDPDGLDSGRGGRSSQDRGVA